MELNVTCKVDEIAAAARQTLEAILGRTLEAGQQVFIMAYTPDAVPDEATRRAATASLDRRFAAAHQHAEDQGITADEADAAVNEAMQHIRGRSS